MATRSRRKPAVTIGLLVNIDVEDVARAVAFYCTGLGLTVGRRLGSSTVELVGGPCAIYLLEKAGGTAPTANSREQRHYSRHWTPVHLDFVVPSVDAAAERARAAGARLEGPIQTHRWGRMALLSDPFGHGFCLIEFTGRGYDEIAG